tara:strand:- start:8934 stop:9152 length:219 start_codon:yes stop_codon:yes gene_type:complete
MTEVLLFLVGFLTGGISLYLWNRSSNVKLAEKYFDEIVKNKFLKESIKVTTKKPNNNWKKKRYNGKAKSKQS